MRLVFVASPRIRFWGTREVAMLSMAASNVGVVQVLCAAQTLAMSKFWRGPGFASCPVRGRERDVTLLIGNQHVKLPKLIFEVGAHAEKNKFCRSSTVTREYWAPKSYTSTVCAFALPLFLPTLQHQGGLSDVESPHDSHDVRRFPPTFPSGSITPVVPQVNLIQFRFNMGTASANVLLRSNL